MRPSQRKQFFESGTREFGQPRKSKVAITVTVDSGKEEDDFDLIPLPPEEPECREDSNVFGGSCQPVKLIKGPLSADGIADMLKTVDHTC
jgi:hypothetical protein